MHYEKNAIISTYLEAISQLPAPTHICALIQPTTDSVNTALNLESEHCYINMHVSTIDPSSLYLF